MDRAICKGTMPIVVLFMVLGAFGPLLAVTAQPPSTYQGIHGFEISDLDPSYVTVDVKWGNVGKASLAGTVTVEKAPAGTVDVTLIPSCSASCLVAVYPDFMTFEVAGTKFFSVYVEIPAFTIADERADIEVLAMAEFQGSPTLEDQTSAVVGINPIFSAYITADPETGTNNPQSFSLNITNMGNMPDSFILDISNRESIEQKGFKVEYGVSGTRELIPRATDAISIEVSYKPSTPWGKYTIELKVVSTAAENRWNATYFATLVIVMDVSPLKNHEQIICALFGTILIVVVLALVIVRRRKGKMGRKRKQRRKKKKE